MSAPPSPPCTRRFVLAGGVAASLASVLAPFEARAQQDASIKLLLDSRFEGPAAMFLTPLAKGYFKAEKLNVQVDAGNGSGNTVTRVASGTYDMGLADLAALMEFHANNPAAPNKPVAVMVVCNNTPAAVLTLRHSGIAKPADLSGRKVGAPPSDAGRRAWPIFAKMNRIENVAWTSMEAPLREAMLLHGDVDAITGVSYTSLLELEARGAKLDDIVVMPYSAHGVKLYGKVVIASEELVKKNPTAVKAFLRAFTRGVKDVIADPRAGVATVMQRDANLDEALELRRLRLALEQTVLTPDARADGFGDVNGSRLSLMASQVSDAFATRERVNPNAVWNGSLLPRASERNIFAAARK